MIASSEKQPVIQTKGSREFLGRTNPNRPLPIFHLGKMGLGDPAQACELGQTQRRIIPVHPQHRAGVRPGLHVLPPPGTRNIHRFVIVRNLNRSIDLPQSLHNGLCSNPTHLYPNTGLFHGYQHSTPRYLSFPQKVTLVKRHSRAPAAVAAILFIALANLLSSCNLAPLIGNPASAIQSFSVDASNNPSLSQDTTAQISGNNIYITLPYSTVQAQTPLTPTVQLAPGYTLSPSGAFAFEDGMTITAIKTATSQTTTYRLHVAVSTETAPTPGAFSAIVSYVVKASSNPALGADADAVIIGTNVYIQLPYQVVSGGAPLTPTVVMAPGYTISPSGTYVLNNNMTLAVTQTSNGQMYNYVLHVSATPSSQYAGSSSLIQSFVVTAALNPSLTTDATAIINGSNLYISLPYADVTQGVKLTPTVTLQSGYTISPSGSYAMSDGMTLTITQTATAAIANYTLHVGTSAASMAFLNLATPFYYDSSGTKQTLSSSNYSLSYNPSNNTYTLTLNTDSFTNFAPYYGQDTQAVLARPIGFGTVETPYNATVTGASSGIAGATPPYTITVKSADGTVTNTYTVDVVRTPSAWIGISSASVNVTNVYDYTDTPGWGSSLPNWQGQSSGLGGANNQQVFWNGGSYGTACGGTQYTFSPNSGANTNATNAALGASDSGAIVATPSALSLPTNLTLSASASYPALSSPGVVSTRTGSFSVSSPYTTITAGGQGCGIVTNSSGTANASPSLTVYLTRTYTSAGYVVPTSFSINVPLAITIQSVTGVTDLASYSITAGSTDNTITLTMGATTARLAGAVASIQCKAENGNTQTLYVDVQ